MRIELCNVSGNNNKKQSVFRNNQSKDNKKYNTALAICGGMAITPLLPMIDGDSFKSTVKDRNVAKYLTGMAAVGGMLGASYVLGKKYCSDENKTAYKTTVGAVLFPSFMLVDNWASTTKKPIAKKWYFVGALFGGMTGYVTDKINNTKA